MSGVHVNGHNVELDDDGFLINLDDWSEDIVTYLALQNNISQITDSHWKVINYLRNYFKKFGAAPMTRKICKDTGFSLKEIYELFSSDHIKVAYKLAGLRKPTGCV
jgi:tRNA 2-thiouridine synthesizing protein E